MPVQKFSFGSGELMKIFFEPLLNPCLDLFHVVSGFLFGQLLVRDMIKKVIIKGHLNVTVPFDDGGTEVLITRDNHELSIGESLVDGISLGRKEIRLGAATTIKGPKGFLEIHEAGMNVIRHRSWWGPVGCDVQLGIIVGRGSIRGGRDRIREECTEVHTSVQASQG